jgi:putative addiction module component (TIGR02574 family)
VSIELDRLKEAAAKLTISERADLAYTLLQSLDAEDGDGDAIERAWHVEIARRMSEIDRGEVTLIPGDEVLADVRRQLG